MNEPKRDADGFIILTRQCYAPNQKKHDPKDAEIKRLRKQLREEEKRRKEAEDKLADEELTKKCMMELYGTTELTTLDEELENLSRAIDRLEESTYARTGNTYGSHYEQTPENGYRPNHMFNTGYTLDVVKGKGANIHQNNPNDGPGLIPRYFRDIDGVRFEFAPGRGFRIAPHHKGDD